MTPEEQILATNIWDAYCADNDDFVLRHTEGYGYINFIKDEKAKAVIKALEFAVTYIGKLER